MENVYFSFHFVKYSLTIGFVVCVYIGEKERGERDYIKRT